jgi:hypothetical protein
MAVKIIYKDGANWVPLSGINIQYFGNSRNLNITTRIIPTFAAPISVVDIWGGRPEKIQEIRFDSYTIQFSCKEDQLNEISRIKSCDSINIVDIANNIDHIADNTTAESFQILEPEKIINTTNYIIRITYRINKTIIDKVSLRDNVATLEGFATYYSKYEKLKYSEPNVNIEVDWSDGKTKTIRETRNNGHTIVLYFNNSDLSGFLNDFGQGLFTLDSIPVIKKNSPEVTQIAEDLNKVVLNLVTTTSRTTYLSITRELETNNITIDTSNIYYTDYDIEVLYEDTKQNFADNEQGYGTLTNAITRYVSRLKFYMTDSELADFKNRFETSQSMTVNSIPILTNRIIQANSLDYDLNEVIATCLTATNILYPQQ